MVFEFKFYVRSPKLIKVGSQIKFHIQKRVDPLNSAGTQEQRKHARDRTLLQYLKLSQLKTLEFYTSTRIGKLITIQQCIYTSTT